MKIGIVGLPNVGKSTLFNAITNAGAECANYPFCTIEPNVGVVPVPDERLDELAKMYNPEKVTHAIIEFVDIAGLVKGASKGEGLGNKFLSHIETVDKRLDRAKKMLKADKKYQAEIDVLEKIKKVLEEGKSARTIELSDEEKDLIKETYLLTMKPILYIANISESDIENPKSNELVKQVEEYAKAEKAQVIPLCIKIEEELASLDGEDKKEMLEAIGLKESGLDRVIKASYDLLGLMSFLTAGEPEVRAWTIKKGTKAPEAAGKIHSDIERGFIRAEIVSFDDLIKEGSMVAAKEKGLVRSEGKEYIMKDGDIVLFRFNV